MKRDARRARLVALLFEIKKLDITEAERLMADIRRAERQGAAN